MGSVILRIPRLPRHLFSALVCAVALSGCTHDTTGPSSTQPFSVVDLTPGTGTAAAANLNLTVDYTGWLYDPSKVDSKGLVFDTSIGKTPFTFTLGAGQVIAGWDQGLVGMKVGGVRRLVVPPSLGYGTVRNNSIPPYATLLFEITLIDVVDPNATATTSRSARTSHQ
jgi:FKBP-type peptidyl-prolyl cis-trans isomerase FkpA